MEDVVSYNPEPSTSAYALTDPPRIGEKRNLMETMSTVDAGYLLPEKRPQVSIMAGNTAYNNKQLLMKQQERGEKRPASELIPQEPRELSRFELKAICQSTN